MANSYAWEEPLLPHKLLVKMTVPEERLENMCEFNLDDIKAYPPIMLTKEGEGRRRFVSGRRARDLNGTVEVDNTSFDRDCTMHHGRRSLSTRICNSFRF